MSDRTIIDTFLFEHLNCDDILNEYDNELQHFNNLKITTERLNSDSTINAYGYKMLDLCKNNCIYCINGRCAVDPNIGKCTSKGVSTIDYFLTTANLFPYIEYFTVNDFCPLLSDCHNPVSLRLSIRGEIGIYENSNVSKNSCTDKLKLWDSKKANTFNENLNNDKINEILQHVTVLETKINKTQMDIDQVVNEINDNFLESVETSFGTISCKKPETKTKTVTPSWFGPECKKARKQFHSAKYFYNLRNNYSNKLNLKRRSKTYKHLLRKHYTNFKKQMSRK